MIILAIECSAVSGSVALLRDGQLLCEDFINNKLTHSATLLPMIEHCLTLSELTMDDLSAIAVSAGPGSFTGVRIGINTVKGLAASRGLPCVPVSSLLGMAYGASYFNGILSACMDARCGQVYNALFFCENGSVTRLTEDRAITIEELEQELAEKTEKNSVSLIGDGALLCYNSFKEGSGVSLVPEHLRFQRASGIALAAEQHIRENKAVPPEQLLPFYLRQAKIN